MQKLLAFFVIVTVGIILAKADWQIYDCSVLPRDADTAWHETSATEGHLDDTPEILSVIDDPDIQGNKLIKVESGENVGGGAFKEVWSYPWKANADNGVTLVFRTKNLDPNSFDRGLCMYIGNGVVRERVITKSDGRFKFDKGGVYVEGFEGTNEWHIYRITLIGNEFTLYIDEDNTAWANSNGESSTGNYIQFGDAGGDTYGALYDWFAWDTTGAYAPSEKPLPSDLTGLPGGGEEKKKCLIITKEYDRASEQVYRDWLSERYDIEQVTGSDIKNGVWTVDDVKQYDFAIALESISSSDIKPLKGAPVPMVVMDCWTSKWDVMGWVPTNSSPDYYGNVAEGDIKIVNADHPLAAGYSLNSVVTLATGSDDTESGAILTYSVPQVDHITIGVLTSDNTREVVFGVEAGTDLYNDENTKDGSVKSENRVGVVGIHEMANAYLTDDVFNFLEAAIDWVLMPVGIKEEKTKIATKYSLEQNYPNPFNPVTTIPFEILNPGFVKLTVYNMLGHEVTTLVNEHLDRGVYKVEFNGEDLPSGIYFYKLQTNGFTGVKKMMLVK